VILLWPQPARPTARYYAHPARIFVNYYSLKKGVANKNSDGGEKFPREGADHTSRGAG